MIGLAVAYFAVALATVIAAFVSGAVVIVKGLRLAIYGSREPVIDVVKIVFALIVLGIALRIFFTL